MMTNHRAFTLRGENDLIMRVSGGILSLFFY